MFVNPLDHVLGRGSGWTMSPHINLNIPFKCRRDIERSETLSWLYFVLKLIVSCHCDYRGVSGPGPCCSGGHRFHLRWNRCRLLGGRYDVISSYCKWRRSRSRKSGGRVTVSRDGGSVWSGHCSCCERWRNSWFTGSAHLSRPPNPEGRTRTAFTKDDNEEDTGQLWKYFTPCPFEVTDQ